MHPLKQYDLWGKPIEETRPSTSIMTLDFEGSRVRMVMVKNEPWWVLTDVARVLGYKTPKDAVRLLRERHKGAHEMRTPGGPQRMLIVSEPGLYRLMMRSNQPEAERFQDWVTDEVLPTIRKTGTYTVKDRVGQTARRLKTDRVTAEKRLDNTAKNKQIHARLAGENATPNDFAAIHDAVYLGQFNRRARDLRKPLGMKSGTPLDRMTSVPLAANTLAKAIAERIIEERARQGQAIPLSDQPAIYEATARELIGPTLQPLGSDARYGIAEDPKRGRVIDVVAIQLPSPA